MASGALVAVGVDVNPASVRLMIALMVLLLLGRGLYDLLRLFSGAPRQPSVGVLEAMTSRKTSPAAGYLVTVLVILFLLFLRAHLHHLCSSGDPTAHDFWGDCST